jgi:hypothetical protein
LLTEIVIPFFQLWLKKYKTCQMATLFIPNFDFEHQLTGGGKYQPNAQLKRINQELVWTWLCLVKNGDSILTENLPEPSFLDLLQQQGITVPNFVQSVDEAVFNEIIPWGWSEQIELLDQSDSSHPSIEAVRIINSRSYSHQIEEEWHVGLKGSIQFENLETMENHLKHQNDQSGSWIIKSEFAMSGRERITGDGSEFNDSQINWINKRIRSGQKLFFEPRVHPVKEAGIQFTIPQHGNIILEGVVPLLSTSNGGYQGSLISHSNENHAEWKKAIEWGFQVAQKIQKEGYWGPLGIDAMIYENNNQEQFLRPVQDINGRWTMGRCALEFRKFLNEGEEGILFHLARKKTEDNQFHKRFERLSESLIQPERILQLSPRVTNGIPNRLMIFLIITRDRERSMSIAQELTELEQH